MHGDGVATYANGDVYTGKFEGGKRQGVGTMAYSSGQEQTGDWTNGAFTPQTPPATQEDAIQPAPATEYH